MCSCRLNIFDSVSTAAQQQLRQLNFIPSRNLDRVRGGPQSRASALQRSMASNELYSDGRRSDVPATTPSLEVRGRVASGCTTMVQGFKFVPRGHILLCTWYSFRLNFSPTAALCSHCGPLHTTPRFASYTRAPPSNISVSCFILCCLRSSIELIGPSMKLGFDLLCSWCLDHIFCNFFPNTDLSVERTT